jgi:hypothetical protein
MVNDPNMSPDMLNDIDGMLDSLKGLADDFAGSFGEGWDQTAADMTAADMEASDP